MVLPRARSRLGALHVRLVANADRMDQNLSLCPACARANDVSAGACTGCGAKLVPDQHGQLVDGRYAIRRELGRGNMGVVYLAQDVGLERDVALKLLSPDRTAGADEAARLRAEAAALAKLRSDHVVQVYAFGPHAGSFFFAMEYVRGQSVSALIAEYARHRTPFPLARAVAILRAVASGLAAAHAAGVVHRDVKPANVVVEERSGRPVLLDFGLARRREDLTVTAQVGTPAYMAPEQIAPDAAGAVSPRTDIYALGCMAFELLTGAIPFDAATYYAMFHAHLFAPAPAVSSVRPNLAAFDAPVARALAKKPEDRFATALDLSDALGEALARSLEPEATVVDLSPIPEEEVGPEHGGRPIEVLVVDDDPTFRRLAARCAQLAWYRRRIRVRAVESGESAVAAARDRLPQLIVLDFQMPGMDGVETLTHVRDLPGGTSTRVVVVSARVGELARWRFGALGVSDFVAKPIDMPSFVALLTDIGAQAGWVDSAAQSVAEE